MSVTKTRPFDLKASSRDFTLKAQVHSRINEFYEQVRTVFSEINGHFSQLFREKDQQLKHKNISVHREEAAIRLRFEKSKEKELKECYLMLQHRLQDLLSVYAMVAGQPESAKTPVKTEGLDKNSSEVSSLTEKDTSVVSYDITPEDSPKSPRSGRSSRGGFETPPKSFKSNDAWTPSFNTPTPRRSQGEECHVRRRSQQVTSHRTPRARLNYGC